MNHENSCCHTYPNDKLLQPLMLSLVEMRDSSCHTYPNDKLLQPLNAGEEIKASTKLSYLSKR